MRAVRLAAELDFVIDSETMAAILENAPKLGKIAIERTAAEFIRLIDSATPMPGIILLEKLGLLPFIIPELKSVLAVNRAVFMRMMFTSTSYVPCKRLQIKVFQLKCA